LKRVTGIGGIFFNAKDPVALRAWYKERLGIDVQEWGGAAFTWTDAAGNPIKGTTAWTINAADGEPYAPSKSIGAITVMPMATSGKIARKVIAAWT